MIIELRGVDFVNKGGELMLQAILSKIKNEIPGVLFVMEQTTDAPRMKQLEYGIYTKSNFKKLGIPFNYIFALVPLFLRRQWRYVNDSEINVILDASGFAFGDVWGEKKASKRLGDHIEKWKKKGKKVILMPQAFGPFTNPRLCTVVKTIIRYADIIFARDKISLTYLAKLSGNNKKFILAPDFTNLVKGTVPSNFDSSTCEVAIIVNSKMVEINTDKDGRAYINLLSRVINIIKTLGHKPYFLMHEANKDKKVAEMINRELVYKLPIVQEDNPVHVKGIIAKSKAVFTSRYHGLASALSQGIPCLSTAWGHKYEMLLKDYNYPEGMVDVYCDDDSLLAKLKLVLTNSSRYLIMEKLKYGMVKEKQRSEEMWAQVFKVIGHKKMQPNYSANPIAPMPLIFF